MTELEQRMLKSFEMATPEIQDAILWIMDNIDGLRAIFEKAKLSSTDMETLEKKAEEQKNCKLLALLRFKQLVDAEQQENCQNEE